MSDIINAYTFHGLNLREKSDNHVGTCPFCDKVDHFFVLTKTGQYNCRRCHSSGNLATFLEEFWKSANASPKNGALQRLATERGLDLATMLEWGLRVSKLDNAFLLPMYNLKGKLSNLARIVKSQGKWVVYGTPTCKLHPFGTHLLQKQQSALWICEGPWDGIALSFTLRNVRSDGSRWIAHNGDKIAAKSHGVIAVPGAGTFSSEWLQYFDNRHARICFDNDHPQSSGSKSVCPGWDGEHRILKLVQEHGTHATKVQILGWGPKGYDPDLPDGFDVRDLCKAEPPANVMSILCSLMHTHKNSSPEKNGKAESTVAPLPCSSFDELCKHYDEHLYFPEQLKLALTIGLATIASTNLAGEQLWFRIIGPPGSGKTTLAECFSVAREYCFPKSIMTGLHSGMNANRAQGKREPSLVPQMNGKCVIIKDADTLLTAGNKDKILGELRDIYDGSSRAQYRTGKKQDFENLRNTFLLCGTDALRQLNRSFLGERFLDCDILGDSETGEYLDSALASALAAVGGSLSGSEARGTHSTVLKQVTYGFVKHICGRIISKEVTIPTCSERTQEQIKAMARLLSFTRARVERDNGEMCYRPRAELATRLVKQFAKLATCLAIVLDKPTIDKEVMSIVRKVLHDTSHGFPYEIIEYLYANPDGKAILSIALKLNIPETTVRRMTDDMLELNILSRNEASNRSGSGGRTSHLWYLSREVREVFKTSKGL